MCTIVCSIYNVNTNFCPKLEAAQVIFPVATNDVPCTVLYFQSINQNLRKSELFFYNKSWIKKAMNYIHHIWFSYFPVIFESFSSSSCNWKWVSSKFHAWHWIMSMFAWSCHLKDIPSYFTLMELSFTSPKLPKQRKKAGASKEWRWN